MDRPILFALDDEPAVLAAVARDLRKEYGSRYRVVRSGNGAEALSSLGELKLRGDEVALLLADQRMPQMTGVEFLSRASELYPVAKRVLLTAYADTDAAIGAINTAGVNHYLTKPWNPPEDHLYPVLNDLLDEWEIANRPAAVGVRLVGQRRSLDTHRLKDFLVRNFAPYSVIDVETDEAAKLLELAGEPAENAPVVFLPDGTHLTQPTTLQLAERLGLRTRPDLERYDLVIVGAGPAGLAGAVYGASEGLSTLLVERNVVGGQAGSTSRIENYLGFPRGLTGLDLAHRGRDQAMRFKAEVASPLQVCSVRADGPFRFVTLNNGTEIGCRSLIIATGVSYRKLDVPGLERFEGSSVFYGAAVTEATECDGTDVIIVGAGNSAGQGAVHLSQYARSVTIVCRADSLEKSMSQYLIDQIADINKRNETQIDTRLYAQIVDATGDMHLESVTMRDSRTGATEERPAQKLFIFIGANPRTDWLGDIVERDRHGFIPTGVELMKDGHPPRGWSLDRNPYWLEASLPGVFAVGDVREGSVKRVASAVGEGSMAVQFVHRHLADS